MFMKHLSKLLTALACVGLLLSFLVSCGSDSNSEPAKLTVNPNSISLLSTANSAAGVSVECTGTWTITSVPEWINVSSLSGTGNTGLTVTALSANMSSTERSGVIQFTSGDLQAVLNVTQLAGLQSGCEVEVTDRIILNTSCTDVLNFGPKASYVYSGLLEASSAGWTDAKIVETLELTTEPMSCKPNMTITSFGLEENTTYITCYVAYDEHGNRGDLLKYTFKTPVSRNAPAARISNVTYSNTLWHWETTINASASEYFMVNYTGNDALDFVSDGFYPNCPSYFALLIKTYLNTLDSYVNSSSWSLARTSDENDLLVATWARRNGEWSAICELFYGHVNSSAPSKVTPVKKVNMTTTKGPKRFVSYEFQNNLIKRNLNVVKL